MPRFFVDQPLEGQVFLGGEDGRHLAKSLRVRPGEEVTLCDGRGADALCKVLSIQGEGALLQVEKTSPSQGEPQTKVTVCQCLCKGDKLETVTQKAVELGVFRIVPVLSRYCVVKLPEKEREKKLARMNKIALEACKQSLRGRVVQVGPVMDFAQAVEEMAQSPCPLLLYEKENKRSLSRLLEDNKQLSAFAVLTGPEGGFSQEEAALAMEKGLSSVSVGPRILRCETAPLAALCAIMYQTGNFDIGE